MKVSVNWLKEYVDVKEDRQALEEVFSSMGFPPEEIVPWGDDLIYDLEVTPNRPDCLSHYGLAREISVFTDRPLRKIEFALEEDEEESSFPVEIQEMDLCPRYVARVVEDVEVRESPEWLREKLEKLGLQSVNSVVDLSNYLLYAIGHPTHVFDLDKLRGKILVRRAREGEKILCLDGIERVLTSEDLVIADEGGPVAIAGVIGGEETGVTPFTRRVLIESAYFNPVAIRKTSRRLGLTTDASYRFERGADPMILEFAADYLAHLIRKTSGGRILRGRQVAGEYSEERKIRTSISFIGSRLGAEVEEDFVLWKLRALGARVEKKGEVLEVFPPSWRRDLEIPEDLVEEIARLKGYGSIEGKLPPVEKPQGLQTPVRETLWKVREILTGLGYTEAMTYIWTSPRADEFSGGRGEPVVIQNPLSKEMPLLRRSLILTLLDSVSLNLRMGRKGVALFEIGRVYWKEGEPREERRLALVEAGEIKGRTWDSPPVQASFYSLKGTVEALLRAFALEPKFVLEDWPLFEEGFSLHWNGLRLGPLKKELLELFDLEVPVFAAELPMGLLPLEVRKPYEDLQNYPSVRRDLSMIFPAQVSFQRIREVVEGLSIPILRSFRLIDLYSGEGIGEGRKSLTLSFEFRAEDRTLRSEEVEEELGRIVDALSKKLGGEWRK